MDFEYHINEVARAGRRKSGRWVGRFKVDTTYFELDVSGTCKVNRETLLYKLISDSCY
jgi:hypothetical protein